MLKVNVFTIGIGHFGLKHQYLIKNISKIFLLVFVLKFTEGETYTAGWAKFHLVINQKISYYFRYPDGFKSQFYNLSEIVMPTLAWGFFGPDENMNALMNYFRDQVMDLIKSLYDVNSVRFTNVEDLSHDIMALAKIKFEQTINHMGQLEL